MLRRLGVLAVILAALPTAALAVDTSTKTWTVVVGVEAGEVSPLTVTF